MIASDDLDLKSRRPQFLKILCILTFIGSSMAMVKGVVDYTNAEFTSRILSHVTNDSLTSASPHVQTDKPNNLIKNMLRDAQRSMTLVNIRHEAMGSIISSLLCLIGALLMWYLQKTGFVIYILGVGCSIAIPFFLFGSASFVILKAIPLIFTGVLFIIFYGMNLKRMNLKVLFIV